MNANETLITSVLNQIPVPKDVDLGTLDDLGVVALLLLNDPNLADKWYRSLIARGNPTPLETFATLLVEREEVSEGIDARLASRDFAVCDDLLRLGIGWSHPQLAGALDNDEHRFAAAWLMIETGDDDFEAWMADCDDAEAILDTTRVMGLLGFDEYLEDLWDWRGELAEGSSEEEKYMSTRLDASIAMISPTSFGRGLLKGDAEAHWLRDPRLVADFFHATGPNSWLDTLAILDATRDSEAFEFASHFGIAAATAGVFGDEGTLADVCEKLLLNQGDWRSLSNRPQFGLVLALTDDEALQRMLVEAAANEYLLTTGGTPGIPGLPLSGSQVGTEEIDLMIDSLAAIEDSPLHEDQVVAAVRLFCDLAYWARSEPETVETLRAEARRWSANQEFPEAIRAAASYALSAFGEKTDAEFNARANTLVSMDSSNEALAELADSEDLAGLAAVERLAWRGQDAVLTLAELWRSGPVSRSDIFREATLHALGSEHESEE